MQTLETEVAKKQRIWLSTNVSVSIFDMIANTSVYPAGYTYMGSPNAITNGQTSLTTLLGLNTTALLILHKADEWYMAIEIFDYRAGHGNGKFLSTFCVKNYNSLTFIVVNPDASPTVSSVTINKAT